MTVTLTHDRICLCGSIHSTVRMAHGSHASAESSGSLPAGICGAMIQSVMNKQERDATGKPITIPNHRSLL